jgi:hypothetical protein
MDDLVLKLFGKSKKVKRLKAFFDELTILEEMQSKAVF